MLISLQFVSEDENSMLVSCPSIEEIKKVVFVLNSNRASGRDGFRGYFFDGCRDIVGFDVCNVVKQFFYHNWILLGMNTNMVSLVP